MGLSKMWSLKRFVMLKYESRATLHTVQDKWQADSEWLA